MPGRPYGGAVHPTPPLPNLRCSGLGVVPKKDGGWRVICHLSAPEGRSINEFINPMYYSLHYHTIDSAISILNTLGCNCLMGKIDLKMLFGRFPSGGKTGTSWASSGKEAGM